MSNYILLTGSTGLVGRYLVRDLLLSGNRLALVVRSSKKQNVYERVEEILQKWEAESGVLLQRPVCFEGDVSEPHLGLSEVARRWIAKNCNRVLHNAAILTFHGADRSMEPWRTNLDGTKNTLQLCKDLGLHDLHYVSTAYVCGCREGVIREDELDCGQKFRNDYEQSKFLAEKLVREADFLKQLTVYRPAVIAGDSKTGYTSTYHGLYMYLQLMTVINKYTTPDEHGVRHTNIRFDVTGDEPRNVVPVDWVSEVISYLFNNPSCHGQTYHLSPIRPITPKDIINWGYKFFNSCGVEFLGQSAKLDENELNPLERAAYENKTMYREYEGSDPTFDTTNLLARAGHLPCPLIDDEMLTKFTNFADQDRWGRRKAPPLVIPIDVRNLLQTAATESEQPAADFPGRQQFGLDVVGSGGGQWLLTVVDGRLTQVEPGLPNEADDVPVLKTSAAELVEFVQHQGQSNGSAKLFGNGLPANLEQFAPLCHSLAAAIEPTKVQE